jgi:phage/plasmid-associated DNA primase
VIKSDDLMTQLMSEAPAILAWAVQGCRDYLEVNGLDTPEVIRQAVDEFRREQDSIGQFLEERCETLDRSARPGSGRISQSEPLPRFERGPLPGL